MTESIQNILDSKPEDTYSRFDSSHPYDIYLGKDSSGRKSLAIILNAEKENITSTKNISVEYFKRSDSETMIRFSLDDSELSEIFYKFCEDIIESTRNSDAKDGFRPIVERWNTWIQFFQKTALPLTESEVLGLIGEVYFLSNVMIEKYGHEAALESYIGTDKAHKDFVTNDTWHEVKSIHHGVRAVKISSIEQLDSPTLGLLEVLTFDQGTPNAIGNITLNTIISEFRSTLDNKWRLLFDEKMRKTSYVEDGRYDEYNYLFIKIDEFRVDDRFPKLVKASLPTGITKASYEIDLSAIEGFRV